MLFFLLKLQNKFAYSNYLTYICIVKQKKQIMETTRFKTYYASTQTFKYYNANPTSEKRKSLVWNKPDCVIRAFAKASGMGWLEAWDWLAERARKECTILNDATCNRKWFVEAGAKWVACKAEKGKSRMTAKEFAETHPTGSYIVSLAKHDTACVDGVIYDTWNCGSKAVVGYYDMENFTR